ncbi:MAG: iron-containing alcohol dehydrogenase [Clostridiales bacterium]|nr:iron-containing alcohol dehydrogenase [Clostridiales bacterium]
MNILSKIYCRTFQTVFRWIMPMLPYRQPETLNSVMDIKNILRMNYIESVLIVTDEGIRNLKLTKPLEDDLKNYNIKVAVYDKTVPNPTIQNVEEGLEIYNQNNCQGIIAFGGGSVMDCAKMIGARAVNPKKSVKKLKGLLKVKNKLPMLIAIPTTAGTGSETTVTAVITDKEKNYKYTINDFNLIPNYAILDAELTLGLPKHITSTTGMDALTHAIEAYIGNSTTEETRKASLEACRLIFENITKVYDDGSNLRSRQYMLKASYLAGVAFTRSYVGYVHAIAHTLGGKYNTPHGLANAVILPYVLSEYGKTIYPKIKELAIHCNIARRYDSDETATNLFINKLFELNEYMGIPRKFDFIKKEDINGMAKKASKEANPLYPVPKLMSKKQLTKLYYKISL